MASYRNISINFWTDSKVDDEFTPEDKYFYLYLLTNPHTSLCGCYEISMKQMERETGYNSDTIKRLIERMEKIHNVIRFSPDTKEVLILNWYKFNWSKSEKVRSAIISAMEYIKNDSFKRYVIDRVYIVYQYRINTVSIPNPPDTDTDTVSDTDKEYVTDDSVSIGYQYPMDKVSETETKKSEDKSSDSHTKSKKFVKPTLEEVKSYCKERNNDINAEKFMNYYDANGWKVGKNPMKDWKAAIKTWENNGYDRKETTVDPDIEKYKCLINKF